MSSALYTVRHFFPKVKSVRDAVEDAFFEVTARDSNSAAVKDHAACAAAVACKRQFAADGVIISTTTAYIVHGNKAVRYQLPESVSREVISFDRKAGFREGKYELHKPPKSAQLGTQQGSYHGAHTKGSVHFRQFRHYTTDKREDLKVYGSRRSMRKAVAG